MKSLYASFLKKKKMNSDFLKKNQLGYICSSNLIDFVGSVATIEHYLKP